VLSRELQEERRRAEEAAVGGERARIAQELHDVLGHELTLIAIQAEAAGVALHVDPDRVAAPVETIRTTAHRALAEMREVVGVLAATPGPDQSQPTEDLVVLTDRARDAGVPNTLSVTGTPEPAHSAVSLAVHRIVRECLTNAGRHAPGEPVTVAVDWADHEVAVAAVNAADPGARVAPGRGLTGIRHRAELLGGTYRAGAVGSRFEVRVVIPRPERVAS
jgi:signal transduction histidine kinase